MTSVDFFVNQWIAGMPMLWPEFAANGKVAITVRQALSHQAGLPYVEGDSLRQRLSADNRLSIEEARRVAPHNNATSLQVTAAVLLYLAVSGPPRRFAADSRPASFSGRRSAGATYKGAFPGAWPRARGW